MIQVLEGEGAIAEEPRADGRDRPEEGRRRARSAPTSPTASTPTPCTARTPPRPPRSRSRSSSRHERPQPLTQRAAGIGQPARVRPRRAAPPGASSWARSGFARPSCSAGSTSAASPTSTRCPTWPSRCATSWSARAEVAALPVASEQVAADGTIKWLFDVGAGDAVETVFIPEADRGTLCISSQAGCAVGCRFCSTGHQGFSRNLTHRRDRRPALARRARAARAPRPGAGRTRDHATS